MVFDQLLIRSVDAFFALYPRRMPPLSRLRRVRLIAHRGAHGPGRPENTLAAFDAALQAGLWGIELDLRWSADREPVVLHDSDCRRVFGRDCAPSDLALAELRRQVPEVPTLEEVCRRYGGRLHLMLEIKAEPYPDRSRQSERLAELLSALTPGRDYHLLSLDPALFKRFPWVPPETCVTVAETNVAAISAITLQRGYGAFTGHYLLLGRKRLERHHAAGQKVGVGFPASANSLRREITRGVDWIFTNHALRLQGYLDDWLNGVIR